MGQTPNAQCSTPSDKAQFAILSQTCHDAVLNKLLYLDLSRQTFTPGLMLDYDAKAAFDRVISGIENLACQHLGLPSIVGTFMHNLLHDMSFHVITAFGRSTHSSSNSDDPSSIGQGVLQGSSSACPIYIFSSNVCLSTYKKHSTGAKFIHPISGNLISNSAIQFADDTSRFTNSLGCGITDSDQQPKNNIDSFFNHAQKKYYHLE